MKSLAGRLSAALAVSLVLLLALQWLIATIAINRLTEQLMVARLSKDAESLLAALQTNAQGDLQLDPRRISPRYQRPFSGYYYTIASGDKREVSRSLWDSAFESPTLEAGGALIFRSAGPEKRPLLVVARGYRPRGKPLDFLLPAAPRSENYDRQPIGASAPIGKNLHSRTARQAQIEYRDIVRFDVAERLAVDTVDREIHRVSGHLQRSFELRPQHGVVFDQQQPHDQSSSFIVIKSPLPASSLSSHTLPAVSRISTS